MGLERTICVLTGKKSVYETDLFAGILGKIAELSGRQYGEVCCGSVYPSTFRG